MKSSVLVLLSILILAGFLGAEARLYGLSGSDDRSLMLWDLNTGSKIRELPGCLHIYSVAYSPDGKYALSGSLDQTVKLWDINTGACVRTFTGHTDQVNTVAFSPDSKYALSGSGYYESTLKLWDINTGACIRTFTGDNNGIN
jgi:WD40 repeat protein